MITSRAMQTTAITAPGDQGRPGVAGKPPRAVASGVALPGPVLPGLVLPGVVR